VDYGAIVEYTTEKPPVPPIRRAVPRFVETEAEAAEVRRVTAGIVGNGALPMNIYGEKE
jgi:hypothetical protein